MRFYLAMLGMRNLYDTNALIDGHFEPLADDLRRVEYKI